MPNLTPALAVADGVITFAGNQERGHALVINHNNGWASFYSGLATLFVQATMRSRARLEHVVAGGVLGYVGDGALHYELWKLDDERHFEPVGDTLAHMQSWLVLPWNDNRFTPDKAAPLPSAA
jgi:murein DD-endopeptidase MepM/ murein hydrolase activator NlpD